MNLFVSYALCALGGYLLGCVSPSYLIGRLKGYDVRRSGSGNAGASNTVIMAGKLLGFLVAVLDILKSAVAWWIAAALLPEAELAGPIAGVGALLGHMFPVFLHFRGGRGLACLGGLALASGPLVLPLMLGIALMIGILTNYVCIVTVCMALIFPLYFGLYIGSWQAAAVLAVPFIPILCKHLTNFRRIREGKELRLSFVFHKDKELARIGYRELDESPAAEDEDDETE